MNLCFEETCYFCRKTCRVDEWEDFYEGETEIIGGDEYPVPTFVTNKTTAKRWIKSNGWIYYKKNPFCDSCYKILKKSFVVMDQFNFYYKDRRSSDFINKDYLLSKKQAIERIRVKTPNEELYKKNAWKATCDYIDGKDVPDIVGLKRLYPDVPIVVCNLLSDETR